MRLSNISGRLRLSAIVIASALMPPAIGSAATYLVDFNKANVAGGNGTSASLTGATPTVGAVGNNAWNSYDRPVDVTGALLDSTGAATTVNIGTVNTTIANNTNADPANSFNDSGNNATTAVFDNTTNGTPAWATNTSDNRASGDYFFTNNANTAGVPSSLNNFTVTLTGLTSGQSFSLDLLSSRNDADSAKGFYEYSLNGGTSWTGFTVVDSSGVAVVGASDTQAASFSSHLRGYNSHQYMNATGLLTGTSLYIRVTDDDVVRDNSAQGGGAMATIGAVLPGGYAVLNAVRLITPVPEPTSALAIVGLSAVLLRRRTQ